MSLSASIDHTDISGYTSIGNHNDNINNGQQNRTAHNTDNDQQNQTAHNTDNDQFNITNVDSKSKEHWKSICGLITGVVIIVIVVSVVLVVKPWASEATENDAVNVVHDNCGSL
jgi:hypothetical protein